MQTLKKKEKFVELSKIKCLKIEYLTILLRELNSALPKPNKIKDFAGITADTAAKLEKIGIKDTQKLFDKVITPKNRNELTKTTVDESVILELAKFPGLSGIKWVGATFARGLYVTGVDTVEKATKADPVELP